MATKVERWRRQSADALTAAATMSDAGMARAMWHIAIGYRVLAERAERGVITPPAPASSVSYGPEALATICRAFDDAWQVISANAGTDPEDIQVARVELANAILAVADEDTRDANAVRNATLEALAMGYRLDRRSLG